MPTEHPDLWRSNDPDTWRRALGRYESVIDAQGSNRLPEHDRWYRKELPTAIASRELPHVTYDEIVRITEWKMARGVWRARNLALVKANDPTAVERTSREALGRIPHPTGPISTLARLGGIGPATASAVAAAAAPTTYPFFDEVVAAQVPGLGPVKFTLSYYAKYAEGLRDRASALGAGWTPVLVERALWSNVGGKAALRS